MYLVQARLRPADTAERSDESIAPFFHEALRGVGLQHVSVHAAVGEEWVLGLFLTAPSLHEAERTASEICLRALAGTPELRGLVLTACAAAAPMEYYDRLAESAD
ncbi:hypothetical protein ACFW9N_17470 [Streptomyces sp. NPDC059496]|uniref:hypothetical protein n=1 Tax=Streptomyces sp. NPDC059496 TaxID=3346851 RepID=UPI00367C0427